MKLLSLSLLVITSACATRPEPLPSTQTDGPQNPLKVEVQQTSLEEGEAKVVLTLSRASTLGEVHLSFDAPADVRVLGLERDSVLPADQVGQWQVPVTLRWNSGVPPTDFTVRLAVDTSTFKAGSSAVYRFGRPEPELPHVRVTPGTVRVGEVVLSGAVDMGATPPAPPPSNQPNTLKK